MTSFQFYTNRCNLLSSKLDAPVKHRQMFFWGYMALQFNPTCVKLLHQFAVNAVRNCHELDGAHCQLNREAPGSWASTHAHWG